MAQMTILEVFNEVARNCGEQTVEGLTALSGLRLLIWNKIIEALQEICTDLNCRYKFLESLGRVTLTTGNYIYPVTAFTTGTDMMREDRESLRQADSGNRVKYITPQEFDDKHPKGITTDVTGYPDRYTFYGNGFVFNKQATAVENGKFVDFRYWKKPTIPSTATATATFDIPEPFDRTVLVALATMKVLVYLGNDEAAVYKAYVYGDGRDAQGSLDKMKDIHSSPSIKPRVTYHF